MERGADRGGRVAGVRAGHRGSPLGGAHGGRRRVDGGIDPGTCDPGEVSGDGGLGYDVLAAGDGDDLVRGADGLSDRIDRRAGADRVEADTADVVAADCGTVSRTSVTPPAGVATNDTTAPAVRAGGPTLQRLRRGRVHLLATTTDAGDVRRVTRRLRLRR